VRTDSFAEARLASNLQQAARGGPNIVFLGDSIFDYWTNRGATSWQSMLAAKGAADFGILGNTTGNLLAQIAAGELKGKPKLVVLMIGTNNVLRGDNALQVAQGIAANVALVRTVSPQSQILLMGLLPIGTGLKSWQTQMTSAVNAIIARLDDGSHVHFVNGSGLFLLSNGARNSAMYSDAVHPSALGYAALARIISPAVDALTGHPGPPPLTPAPAPPPLRVRRR
jgi:lysophospholipase L1-like esterase